MEIFGSICTLLAGIAVFLLGMKLMGEGLESGAGKSVKKMFARIGNNRFASVGIGAGTTAVIQSSSATTVMVVGFVNAGVMTLFQAAAIIMGANIGTTVTAFLGVLADLPVAPIIMASGIAGVFMFMFSKNKKVACAGQIIIGLAVIFVGMSFMGSAFKNSRIMSDAFSSLFLHLSFNPAGPLLLVLIGAIFTGIVQSSSATTVMVVDMVTKGIIPVDAAIFIVMGANIGTCVTAMLASIGTSANAKRAAMIHLIFNMIGTLIFVPVVWIFKAPIAGFLGNMFPANAGLQVALFHLFFNVITTAILLSLVKQLVWLATKMIPGKKGEVNDEPRLFFIDEKLMQPVSAAATAMPAGQAVPGTTPEGESAILQSAQPLAGTEDTPLTPVGAVLAETFHMAELARVNLETAFNATLIPDISQKNKIINTEQKINYINIGIGRYLVKLSKDPKPEEDTKLLNSLYTVVSDIERIGDHAIEFFEEAAEMKESNIHFSGPAALDLQNMFQKVNTMFLKSVEVFKTRDVDRLPEIAALEKEIDETKHALGFGHISRLNAGECNVESGMHFYAIITALERIADHLANVAFSIKTQAGAQLEALKRISKENAKRRSSKKNIYW